MDGPDALKGLAEADRQLSDFAKSRQEIIPLASILLPSLAKCKNSELVLERELAALRCEEAIRLYAARHDGQLPKALSDVHEVPVPDDPSTGKPFGYNADGKAAILTSPAPPKRPESDGLHWELDLAGGK